MHRISIDRVPGWHIRSIPPSKRRNNPLDVLVPTHAPRGGMPESLEAGKTYHFWADVAIPKGTPEGTYATEIELLGASDRLAAFDVRLSVWPIILPDQADVTVIAEVDHDRLLRHHGRVGAPPPTDPLVRSTLLLLQRHRLTPVLHKAVPIVGIDARGELAIDWSQYDNTVSPYLDGRAYYDRVPAAHWPMPFSHVLSPLRFGDTIASQESTAVLRQFLAGCAQHFAQKGWLDRSYALLPPVVVNGLPDRRGGRRARDFTAVARSADGRIATVSRGCPQDMTPYGWVDYPFVESPDSVDIWLPPAQLYDPRAMEGERAAGRRTWLGVDRPPYSGSVSVYSPPTYVRILSWQAAQLGAEVLYLGCLNRWPDDTSTALPDDCVRADPNILIYPGGTFGLDEPVASVRLKHLRRSMQDAAYRALLDEHGLQHVTATLVRSLAPYAGTDAYRTHFADGRPIGWVDDPVAFEFARSIMAETLIDASYGQRSTQREEFASDAMWHRFVLATKSTQLAIDGARLRLSGTRAAWEADLECALTIMNRTPSLIAGRAYMVGLQEGWISKPGGSPAFSVAPYSSRRVTLSAKATTFPFEWGATLSIPIEFATDDGVVRRCNARVSCVTAVPFNGPISIDGDLSDWPPGAANVASGFRLICGERTDTLAEEAAHPRHATFGFTMRDAEFLYVAINCESDAQAELLASRRNSVEYDDMIPVGEELVELLIDPLNAGTRSPTDLYHIVVKPTGSYLSEKGIRFDPPCGQRAPWAADIDVATRVSTDRWTAELRIPLASLSAPAEHTIWGFNITRFDASYEEFSTWSGASGNAYDPLSLGNLYLP